MSTHNLFEQKYEKYQFFNPNVLFLEVNFSIYLNRRFFVMKFCGRGPGKVGYTY